MHRVDPLAPYLAKTAHEWLARDPDQRWRVEPGTVVFADVSGFTPLTERLAQRGKIGAEELTDVLNDVFGRLLTVVAAYDGDLVKFGGDALLLLFTGDDHAMRGVTCARGLHVALRPFRQFRTGAGIVRLGMSIGVDSGDVYEFMVGATHRELLIAGPTVSTTVEMENTADSGEVLLGPGAIAAVPAEFTGAAKGDGRLLRGSPAAKVAESPRPAPRVPAADGVPPMLREHLGAGREDGEHRLACLSFLQFRGVDALLGEAGPDAVAEALDVVVATAQEACARHGVTFLATDVDKDGGKILFTAGAPQTHDDDADRILLALRESVTADGVLTVRAGVNRGRAFAVDVGTDARRTYAVMGDPTNLAARVMGRAQPGQVVATQALLTHLRQPFALEHLPPFMVKGKAQPVTAAVVGPPAVVGRRVANAFTLVGRDSELGELNTAVATALGGTGCVSVLEAPPGLGKSRLVAELLAQNPGPRVLVAEGGQYAMTAPYWSLRTLMRGALGIAVDADPQAAGDALCKAVTELLPESEQWVPLLAAVVGAAVGDGDADEVATLDGDLRRRITHTQAVRLLSAALPDPTIIVVEDAHWLDEASSRLLDDIAAGVRLRPWAVVVTRRPDQTGWSPSDAATWLRLTPLTDAAAASLLRDAARQRPMSPRARQALVERAAGNPLFLRELADAVDAHGDVQDVPDTVEASISAGIDTLDRRHRDLLRVASVLGGRFDARLLAKMLAAPSDAVDAELVQLERFINVDGTGLARFAHALIRDVAYESLPFRRRRSLHGQAGDLLRTGRDEPVDLLALHYSQAHRFDEAWHYARLAGDLAMRTSAPVEAATFFRWATEAGRRVSGATTDERLEVQERLGDVLQICGRFDSAAAAFDEARRGRREDPIATAALLQKAGWLRERSGRYSDAVSWYRRALKTLDAVEQSDDGRRLHAQVLASLGAARLRQARYTDALTSLLPAIVGAEATGDLATVATSSRLVGWCYTELGDARAEIYMLRALPLYEELGDLLGLARILNDLGISAYYRGSWAQAVAQYERTVEVCRRSGDVVTEGLALGNLGEILSDQGRYADAEEAFADASAIWTSVRHPLGEATCVANQGRLASRTGDHEKARELLAEARARLRHIGADAYVIEVDAREAERLTFCSEGPAARQLADATTARARAMGDMPVVIAMLLRVTGVAAALSEQRAEAEACFLASRERAEAADADYELAVTLQTWARWAAAWGDERAEALGIAAAALLDRLEVVEVAAAPVPPVVTLPRQSSAQQTTRTLSGG